MSTQKQPNFLFIMSDQLRPDRLGYGGNRLISTPHIDALAARGRNFTRAYCTSPSCGPSRNSILTGRMPSINGSWTNALSLDLDANTFVRVLKENGYRTGLIGKSHHQDCIDRRPSKDGSNKLDLTKLGLVRYPPSGEGRADLSEYATVGQAWDRYERHWLHKEEKVVMPKDYYGYDTVELALNHDDIPAGHHYYWVKEQGGTPDEYGGSARSPRPFAPWSQVWQSNTPLEFTTTAFVTERSMAFMDEAVAEERPFFLTTSFADPHHPFAIAEPYYSMYDREAIPLPETFFDDHAEGLPHLRKLAEQRGKDARGPFSFSISEEQYREATAVEYGSITFLDEHIGKLMAHLEKIGAADNTVIIFCADHADLGGDHGLFLKFAAHYQGVLRVPLLIAGPDILPSSTDSMASLLDIGRTVLEMAHCHPYVGMQGHSLLPILNDPGATVRQTALVEEAYQADFVSAGTNLDMRTLVTDKARLTLYHGISDGELYDLEHDPLEMKNLYSDPEAAVLKAEMMALLVQEMISHRDLSRYPL